MGPRNLQKLQRRRQRKISTKTTIMTMEALAEDRRRVQGIGDDNGGGSGSAMVLVDWQ